MYKIITVLIEYRKAHRQVVVRMAWTKRAEVVELEPMEKGNIQNYVELYEGQQLASPVGIRGLKPAE